MVVADIVGREAKLGRKYPHNTNHQITKKELKEPGGIAQLP